MRVCLTVVKFIKGGVHFQLTSIVLWPKLYSLQKERKTEKCICAFIMSSYLLFKNHFNQSKYKDIQLSMKSYDFKKINSCFTCSLQHQHITWGSAENVPQLQQKKTRRLKATVSSLVRRTNLEDPFPDKSFPKAFNFNNIFLKHCFCRDF